MARTTATNGKVDKDSACASTLQLLGILEPRLARIVG